MADRETVKVILWVEGSNPRQFVKDMTPEKILEFTEDVNESVELEAYKDTLEYKIPHAGITTFNGLNLNFAETDYIRERVEEKTDMMVMKWILGEDYNRIN